MTDILTPQQTDREAALSYLGVHVRDGYPMVQAFAHHAQQARLEERERLVAFIETEAGRATHGNRGTAKSGQLYAIATAIRKGEAA